MFYHKHNEKNDKLLCISLTKINQNKINLKQNYHLQSQFYENYDYFLENIINNSFQKYIY